MFLLLDNLRILNLNNVAYIEGKFFSDNRMSITIVTTAIYPNDNSLDRFSEKFVIETGNENWKKLLEIIQNEKKLFVL